jgi:hypothetical protein
MKNKYNAISLSMPVGTSPASSIILPDLKGID